MKRATREQNNYYRKSNYFNPRPREEGDNPIKQTTFSYKHFNPRPREEGDFKQSSVLCFKRISIHALVKRATGWSFDGSALYTISIHALVKRATRRSLRSLIFLCISIHALVKRATTGDSFFAVRACHFNPRPREEGDCLFANGLSFGILFQSTPS